MQIANRVTRETVYEALVDCYNETQRDVKRETLRKITGIKQVTVDEYLRQLIDVDQKVERRKRGYFRPAVVFAESRAVSCTVLPSGMAKVEIGDYCMDLTPAEARKLAPMLGGGAIAESEAIQQNRLLMARYALENKKNRKEINALWAFIRQNKPSCGQLALDIQPSCMA
jgi:hypothetical protein